MTDSVESWSGKDRGDENFPVGSALIAAPLRRHVHAYYAFARNADDIADSDLLDAADKVRRLDVMEAVLLGRASEGSASALGLRASLGETGVSSRHATDLLVAFRQDATTGRYATWEELAEYCRYSAAPVGRYMLDLHGEDRATWPASDALCTVLQVLNHLQDGAKDLHELDRCYLPDDLMAECGASVLDLHKHGLTPGMRRVLDMLLDRCDGLIATAAGLPGATRSRRLRLEVGVILGLARRLAARLRRGDPLAARVKLTKSDAVFAIIAAVRFL